jgi:hypothetical protein
MHKICEYTRIKSSSVHKWSFWWMRNICKVHTGEVIFWTEEKIFFYVSATSARYTRIHTHTSREICSWGIKPFMAPITDAASVCIVSLYTCIKLIAFELAGKDRDRRLIPVLSRLKIAFFALHKRGWTGFSLRLENFAANSNAISFTYTYTHIMSAYAPEILLARLQLHLLTRCTCSKRLSGPRRYHAFSASARPAHVCVHVYVHVSNHVQTLGVLCSLLWYSYNIMLWEIYHVKYTEHWEHWGYWCVLGSGILMCAEQSSLKKL